MLLALILAPLTFAVLLVLALCRGAARGERAAEQAAAQRAPALIEMPGLTVWDCPDESTARPLARTITGLRRDRAAMPARRRRPQHVRAAETIGSRSQ